MPTYEYACSKCGHRFEEFQSISAEPIKICPECKNETVQRLIGGGNGFLFKGSGFYITDYRSKSYQSGKKAESVKPSPSSGSSKKETKKKSAA